MPTGSTSYNAKWVLWQQIVVLFLLYFAPGSQFDCWPIYVAQAYLLLVSLMTDLSKDEGRSALENAALVLVVAAVGGVVTALASLTSMTAVYDKTIGTIHLAVLVAAAFVVSVGSAHIIKHTHTREET